MKLSERVHQLLLDGCTSRCTPENCDRMKIAAEVRELETRASQMEAALRNVARHPDGDGGPPYCEHCHAEFRTENDAHVMGCEIDAILSGAHPSPPSDEMELRRMLWLRHGCPGLYGDDGEMQCGQCLIDFKRLSASEIAERFRQIGLQKMAQPSPADAAKVIEALTAENTELLLERQQLRLGNDERDRRLAAAKGLQAVLLEVELILVADEKRSLRHAAALRAVRAALALVKENG